MSFFVELKKTIKEDFSGTTLSEDSILVNTITKEITNTFKEKYNVSIKPDISSQKSRIENVNEAKKVIENRNAEVIETELTANINLQTIADEIGKVIPRLSS